MIIAGYLASILIGISLGLIGGGGSILTVPVLVYLFGLDAAIATTYSLFVVGVTSAVGSVSYFKKGLVDVKTAFFFGIPSVIAVFLTRTYLIPAIPIRIFSMGNFIFTKSMVLMLFFAIIMLLASLSMIRKENNNNTAATQKNIPVFIVLLQGIIVGMVTGLIGAGGGFLIIPALVNMLKLPMKKAIGTSLFIIAINSLTGFLFSLNSQPVQWSFILTIAAIAIAGILIGSFLSTKIDGKKLKPAFGWFVLVMGIYILMKETLLK